MKNKYITIDIQHIKSLLEELDNNVEMVADILAEETGHPNITHKKYKKPFKNSMDEDSDIDNNGNKLIMNKFEDIKVLKSSLAKLYKKLKA